MADKPEGTSEEKPKFIVLCGPTGVGKSKAPKAIFGLKEEGKDFTKIEIDSLIVQNKFYKKSINKLWQDKGKLILDTIEQGSEADKQQLTDEFNRVYYEVKKFKIPCLDDKNEETSKLNCEKLHDKMLADAINRGVTIVLEINGNNNFDWLLKHDDKEASTVLFKNEHREKLRTNYDIKICYLSHPYKSLLEANKSRFLKDIRSCNEDECNARLGNSLLINTYNTSVQGIYSVYQELLAENFFEKFNIDVSFYVRRIVGKEHKYDRLLDFDRYKDSFGSFFLPQIQDEHLGLVSSSFNWKSLPRDSRFDEIAHEGRGGRKKQKAKSKKQKAKSKKQKAKSKKQKAKKQKSKKAKNIKN
jgi:hypothetical protein